jgi:hypothetical protein
MRSEAQALEVIAGVGIGASIVVDRFTSKTVAIGGTFVATLRVEGTIDGVNWIALGSDITAPVLQLYDQTIVRLRIRTVAFTSGAPSASFNGFDSRSE